MANPDHMSLLASGVNDWNKSRPDYPDLSLADLSGRNLSGVNFQDANLISTNFVGANLTGANLRLARLDNADLKNATLDGATFRRALMQGAMLCDAEGARTDFSFSDLSGANLSEAGLCSSNFYGATLAGVNFAGADLRHATLSNSDLSILPSKLADIADKQVDLSRAVLLEADLSGASLIKTKINGAQLSGARVYGTAVWDLEGVPSEQENLRITPDNDVEITVDNLKVAQFLYLIYRNPEIRDLLDAVTRKAVLILGRFMTERKAVLDAVRNELRKHNYVPIVFDFENTENRNLTETVSTLAHMSRFVIADITDAKSIPQELERIVPHLPSVPVSPIILEGQYEYGMFKDLGDYRSMLPPFRYNDVDHLLASLEEAIIGKALAKEGEIEEHRREFGEHLSKQ